MCAGRESEKMALATIGSLPPVDPTNQEWEEYCEIMEHFFAANEITDAAKQKIHTDTRCRWTNMQLNEKPVAP
jgi:hypothetical protein